MIVLCLLLLWLLLLLLWVIVKPDRPRKPGKPKPVKPRERRPPSWAPRPDGFAEEFDTADGQWREWDGDHLYLICCPGRGWVGSADQEVFWGHDQEEEPPPGHVRLHVFNNCLTQTTLEGVGLLLPLPPGKPQTVDLPRGFHGDLFTRSGTACECPRGRDGTCLGLPRACSFLSIHCQPSQVRFRVSNRHGFSTAYILGPRGTGENSSGGGNFFQNQQVLNQCPEELAFADDGVVTACISSCGACQLEEKIQACQCRVDADCGRCNTFRDLMPGVQEAPLRCISNRCRSKVSEKNGVRCHPDLYCS